MSQKSNILSYLKDNNTFTPLEALNKFGSFRLGAIIWVLIKEGYNIINVGETKNKKHYGKYKLVQHAPYQSKLPFQSIDNSNRRR